MKNKFEPKRILWPIDVFSEGDKVHDANIAMVRLLAEKHKARVEPVYILIPGKIDILTGNASLIWMDAYREAALTKMKALIQKKKLKFCLSPKVIENPHGSVRGAIHQLLDYAKKSKSDLIALSSHARRGMQRLFLGSFAESLLLEADIPILVTNPSTKADVYRRHKILFATDFSPDCSDTFVKMLPFMEKQGDKLVLFNKTSIDFTPFVAGGAYYAGVFIPPEGFLTEQKILKEKQAAHYIDIANKHHIQAEYVKGNQLSSVSSAILAGAKKEKVGLIVLVPQAGKVETVTVGSTIRTVVREAMVPVLVIPTKQKATSKKVKLHRAADKTASVLTQRIFSA